MLLERDREQHKLATLIEAAGHGMAAVCVVEGAAGIGKSRLLADARERAEAAGFAVLHASGRAIELDYGFGVVGQLLSPIVHDHARPMSAALTAILSPEPASPADVMEAPTFASLHGLYRLVAQRAELQPLLLAIDDLHWCDAASLRFFAYLRARLDDLPMLLLFSVRSGHRSADVDALHGVLDDPRTAWLRPRPLTVAATATVIESSVGSRPHLGFAAECHRVTGGNPLLLEQLVSALADQGVAPDSAHLSVLDEIGPAAVTTSVLLRVGRLGAETVATAQALAVLGDGARLAHVAELAALDLSRAAQAVADLSVIDVVRPKQPLGFVHPLVASAIYRDLPVGQRELKHMQAATLLRQDGASVEQVAGHLLRAPASGDPAVVEQLMDAAVVARNKGAEDSAHAYLKRALDEPPTPDRRNDVAWALGRVQASRNGPAAVENLFSAYEHLIDPERRAEVAELLGSVLVFTGYGRDGIRVLRDAAAVLPPQADVRRRLEAFELFAVLSGHGDAAELSRLTRWRSLPEVPGVGGQMLSALAAVHWMYSGGPSTPVTDLALAALADGSLMSTRSSWAAFALSTLTFADRPEAESWWDQLTSVGHSAGSLTSMVAIMHGRGQALWRRGELTEAEFWIREALAAIAQWGFTDSTPAYSHGLLAAILLDRGEANVARQAWSAGRDTGTNDPGTRGWLGCEIELLLAEGAYESAMIAADAYAERFAELVPNPMDVPWRSRKALALAHRNRHSEARELVEAELELAQGWGAPSTISQTLRARGTLEIDKAAVSTFELAVALVDGTPARLEHARALAGLGRALLRAGRSAAAREPLREAMALAAASGAHELAARCRADLLDAGARPRRTALYGVESLTPGELRTVRLAAKGSTNREIAEDLFVTPKTVAMHLSNAYRKLGIASRHQLASVLSDQVDT